MTTNYPKAADADDLPLAAAADALLQRTEAALSIAWEACDHSLRLDGALHDIRCAIDRVQSARDAIATATHEITIGLAADAKAAVSTAADAIDNR